MQFGDKILIKKQSPHAFISKHLRMCLLHFSNNVVKQINFVYFVNKRYLSKRLVNVITNLYVNFCIYYKK